LSESFRYNSYIKLYPVIKISNIETLFASIALTAS